jgi:hypothetical protein
MFLVSRMHWVSIYSMFMYSYLVYRGKGSRPNSVNSYDSAEIRNVVRNENFTKNEATKNVDNHQIKFTNDGIDQRGYNTITRDGARLAVINAEDIEDGLIIVPGRKRNFTVLEEIDPCEVSTIPRNNQTHPYPQYLRNGLGPTEYRDTNTGYSLNVLNLEGESLGSSYNSRYSRHSYELQWNNGKLTQRGMQTSAERTNKNIQADLDHTRTVLPQNEEEGDNSVSLNSSLSSTTLSLPSTMGEELERELLPIRETKASMARK